ncbi:hypothetical protein HYX09_01055 [Candidatus Woesearchaeota archaeon]|nr:hypothetical protein [Candidatus Woesearchaeota archaeon]
MSSYRYTKANIDATAIALILLLAVVTGLLAYSVSSTMGLHKTNDKQQEISSSHVKMSSMSLTPFDRQLAKQLMDANNDGKCDACGMPIEQCIDSGQMQCSMDSNANSMDSNAKIGILGSQHIHSDWKVYIEGKAMDFSDKSHMERMRSNMPVSSFIHVDSGAPAPEKTGDVLHMHAAGVPLWIFFKSVGMDFSKDCINMENKEKFCNDSNKKLKFFVNGKESNEFENYAFKDLDKIVVSYGDGSEEEIKNQLSSITDFAKAH